MSSSSLVARQGFARQSLLVALVAGLAIVVLALALAPAAQAHDVCARHPTGGDTACVIASHTQIVVCDTDPDGNLAYARIYVAGILQPPLYDPDGYGGACGSQGFSAPWTDSFNVCVQNEGCGAPVYRGSY